MPILSTRGISSSSTRLHPSPSPNQPTPSQPLLISWYSPPLLHSFLPLKRPSSSIFTRLLPPLLLHHPLSLILLLALNVKGGCPSCDQPRLSLLGLLHHWNRQLWLSSRLDMDHFLHACTQHDHPQTFHQYAIDPLSPSLSPPSSVSPSSSLF